MVFHKAFFLFFIIAFSIGSSQAQKTRIISGTLKDARSNQPIPFATVKVMNSKLATQSSASGKFSLSVPLADSLAELIISAVGYVSDTLLPEPPYDRLSIALLPQADVLPEVVYSATRLSQHLLTSPVTIERITANGIRNAAAFSYYDALPTLKGVEAVTSGITYKQINTRGFNNTGNQRFLQLIDGVDNQGPGLNFSIGNFMGVSDLDVESVEIIPGAASALYGPIAFNGLLQVRTKDPFQYKGLSIQYKAGLNHIGESGSSPQGLNDIALRYANAWGNKIAVKFNAGYFNGQDWWARDYTDISAATPAAQRGPNNPGRDALNIYGDEVARTLTGIGLVTRTGYAEKELMDDRAYSARWNASLHYRLNDRLTLSYQYRFGMGTAAYTGSSRYSLNNYRLRTHVFELKGRHFFWRNYHVSERSGDTYNTRSLGQFLNRQWVLDLNDQPVAPSVADATWFTRYEAAFKGNISGVTGNDHATARGFADRGRVVAGTSLFNELKNQITHRYGLQGSGVFTQCALLHSEGQYDLSHLFGNKLELLAGGSVRLYDMFTNGSLFDDKNKKLTMLETGVFLQSARSLWDDKLKLTASLRYDKNENFRGSVTPRIAAVFHPGGTHHIRASYQTGFRNPTTVDLFIKLNVGPITILGGAPENSRGMNVYENSFTASSVAAFTAAYNKAMASGGTTSDQALQATKDLLKKSNVQYIVPEQLKAFEVGYKGYVVPALLIDASVYWTSYSQFILNTVVQRPQQTVLNADGSVNASAALDLLSGRSQSFQLYTNSTNIVSSWGFSVGADWQMQNRMRIGGNLTHAGIRKRSDPNAIIDFNTPGFSTNMYVKSDESKLFAFQVNWHWQDAFTWYGTFLGNRPGPIKAYSLFDLVFSKKIPQKNMLLKAGANNLLNNQVVQAYGSPSIGAVYYVSWTYEASRVQSKGNKLKAR